MYRSAFMLLMLWCINAAAVAEQPEVDRDGNEYFERKIRPLLVQRCYECHSSRAKTVHGDLRLDSLDAVRRGGDSGPLLVPGKPEESLLVEVIRYDGDIQMPPKGKLPESEIAELISWVERGAPFPAPVDQAEHASTGIDYEKGRTFWSFQPVQEQPLPQVANPSWPTGRIDSFVLAAMERHGLSPSPPAERATLIRRVTFDLIGLPPTPEEVEAFVHDDSPKAYEELVERLLQLPQYGE